jgi:hypothetical protein
MAAEYRRGPALDRLVGLEGSIPSNSDVSPRQSATRTARFRLGEPGLTGC